MRCFPALCFPHLSLCIYKPLYRYVKRFLHCTVLLLLTNMLLNITLKRRLSSQFFNVVKPKKGSIHELSDAVPLHLE